MSKYLSEDKGYHIDELEYCYIPLVNTNDSEMLPIFQYELVLHFVYIPSCVCTNLSIYLWSLFRSLWLFPIKFYNCVFHLTSDLTMKCCSIKHSASSLRGPKFHKLLLSIFFYPNFLFQSVIYSFPVTSSTSLFYLSRLSSPFPFPNTISLGSLASGVDITCSNHLILCVIIIPIMLA